MIPVRSLRLVSLLSAALLTGCTLPKPHAYNQQTWRVQAPVLRVSASIAQPLTLRLPAFDAATALDTSAMLYSPQPLLLLPYRDNRWLAPPSQMVRDALAQTLAQQSWIASVVEGGSPDNPAVTLDCTLDRFEHDSGAQQLHLALRCRLTRGSDARLLGHWTLQQDAAVTGNDAAAVAAAAQRALDAVAAALLRGIAASLTAG